MKSYRTSLSSLILFEHGHHYIPMAYKAANKPGPSGTSSSGSAKKGVEPGSAEAKLRLAELLKNKPRVDSVSDAHKEMVYNRAMLDRVLSYV